MLLLISLPIPAFSAGLTLNDVLRLALKHNADLLQQQKNVEISTAQILQSEAPFDWNITSDLSYSDNTTPLTDYDQIYSGGANSNGNKTAQYQAGVEKLMRNGWSIDTKLNGINLNSESSSFTGVPDKNDQSISLVLNVPILKSLGKSAASQEETAYIMHQVSRQQLYQRVSQIIINTLGAYWDYLASESILEVAKRSEVRAEKMLDGVAKLIEANEQSKNSILLLQATYADKLSFRFTAEQKLLESKRSLGRLIGLNALEIEKMESAAGIFPEPDDAVIEVTKYTQALAENALKLRVEMDILKSQLEATGILIEDANNNLSPQLDLQFGVAQKRISDSYSSSTFALSEDWTDFEPSVFINVSYKFPISNSLSKGRFLQKKAESEQLEIQLKDQINNISSGVYVASSGLYRSVEHTKASNRAVELFKLTVEKEIMKVRHGMSTISDLVNVEDRLNNALIQSIQSNQNYANALVRLRYETGTLLPRFSNTDDSNLELDVANLLSIDPLLQISFIK